MTEMTTIEAIAPWLATVLVGVVAFGAVDGGDGIVAALMIFPWIGALLSILYINHRYWGNPLRFGPQ